MPPSQPAEPLRTESRLHIAAKRGDIPALREVLEHHAAVNGRAPGGFTALFYADSNDVRQLLLDAGADPTLRDGSGATLLMGAVEADDLAALRFWLERDAIDVNAADSRGFTALHRAAEIGHEPMVSALLERGARADIANSTGHTPLRLAESHQRRGVVAMLTGQRRRPRWLWNWWRRLGF